MARLLVWLFHAPAKVVDMLSAKPAEGHCRCGEPLGPGDPTFCVNCRDTWNW